MPRKFETVSTLYDMKDQKDIFEDNPYCVVLKIQTFELYLVLYRKKFQFKLNVLLNHKKKKYCYPNIVHTIIT